MSKQTMGEVIEHRAAFPAVTTVLFVLAGHRRFDRHRSQARRARQGRNDFRIESAGAGALGYGAAPSLRVGRQVLDRAEEGARSDRQLQGDEIRAADVTSGSS